jgi:hypothetical protein
MSATCLYIFTKGDNQGEYCPTYPRYGRYCAKHAHHDNHKNNLISKIKKKNPEFTLNKLGDGVNINWKTHIVFDENNIPLGKYKSSNIFPLLDSDIEQLKSWEIDTEYEVNTEYFKKKFYPKRLESFIIHRFGIKQFGYPYAVDIEHGFVYKHDTETNTFNFHGILEGERKDTSQVLDKYTKKLLQTINLNGIPCTRRLYRETIWEENQVSEENKDGVKIVTEETFTLKYNSKKCTFYTDTKQESCSICYDKKSLYHTKNCERKHLCCKECWVNNKQNTCPFCRKVIFT